MSTVVCHTEGCGNADIPIELALITELDGVPQVVGAVYCGVCGQPIDDITGPEADEYHAAKQASQS